MRSVRAPHRLALACALAALAAGCSRRPGPGPARHADEREVKDGLGRAVRLPRTVARAVSLAPSTTEILYALGAGPLLVGVDGYSDYPPEARGLPHVGADVDPNLERV